MKPQFVFHIHDLQQLGMRDVDAPLSRAWLADALDGTEVAAAEDREGRAQLRLVTTGRDVVVRGTLTAPVTIQCGRCLASTTVDIGTEVSLFLVPASGKRAPAPGGGKRQTAPTAAKAPAKSRAKGKWQREDGEEVYEFSPDEADADTYVGDEVVLDAFLREAILLELPIFPLCSEECPGIRPVPAAPVEADDVDPPIDPRLAPLLALKKKS